MTENNIKFFRGRIYFEVVIVSTLNGVVLSLKSVGEILENVVVVGFFGNFK